MNKEDIQKYIKEQMVVGIQSVLNGEQLSAELMYVRPNDVAKYVTEIGGKETGEFDSNGWQYDYWMYFDINGQEYCLAGDAYYDDHANFAKR